MLGLVVLPVRVVLATIVVLAAIVVLILGLIGAKKAGLFGKSGNFKPVEVQEIAQEVPRNPTTPRKGTKMLSTRQMPCQQTARICLIRAKGSWRAPRLTGTQNFPRCPQRCEQV